MERVFIVGCGRSGTTMLQSFLAAHPRVVSFPESQLYAKIRSIRPKRGHAWLRIATRAYVPSVRRFLMRVGRTDIPVRRPIFIGPAARNSTALLDRLASEAYADVWVEKTPYHLDHIELIERYVPNSKFLHMVRDGPEVVASMIKVARQFEEWKGPATLDAALERRNKAIAQTHRHAHKSNHLVVHYEQLMADTEKHLRRVCSFIGVEYDPRMVSYRQLAAQNLIDKPWKVPVLGNIDFAPRRTFETTLTASEQQYVLDRLAECSAL